MRWFFSFCAFGFLALFLTALLVGLQATQGEIPDFLYHQIDRGGLLLACIVGAGIFGYLCWYAFLIAVDLHEKAQEAQRLRDWYARGKGG